MPQITMLVVSLSFDRLPLQQNILITTGVITTKTIIVVIHLLLHHLVKFRCNSYLKTDNLLHQK
jgi:hypothetical protein